MNRHLFKNLIIAFLVLGLMLLKSECGFVADVVTDTASCLPEASVPSETESDRNDETVQIDGEETDTDTYGLPFAPDVVT